MSTIAEVEAAGWTRFAQPSEARLMVGCGVRKCGDNARWKRGDEFRCHVHVGESEREACACDESLALRAQLREAAAHVGELLACLPGPTSDQHVTDSVNARNAARAWLTAYLAKGGA